MNRFRWWPTACLALLLLATWCAYAPGLSGGFLFDDFVNLDKLANPGPIDNWSAFWRYITSGTADPTGRPLSLLTFLIDAQNWPADPAPFLRTNVLLHLLNGTLLIFLLRRLGEALGDDTRTHIGAALIGAGLWMLHPLFVSTTLYIVQREAMLPATFTLLGLLAYAHGRVRMASSPSRGIRWIVFGLGIATLLAILSKANGILLPLLAWVLEACVFRRTSTPLPRWVKTLVILLPALVVLAVIASDWPRLFDHLNGRGWSRWERLLTEFRVLCDYLRLLIVPRVLSTGLYNDSYAPSHGILDPIGTLISAIVILGLLAFAMATRRRFPALASALLFFFTGHVLESTTVALELYFEHRNYLPAMLLFWPVGRAVMRWNAKPFAHALVGVLLLAVVGVTTWQRADLWGNPNEMTSLWAQQNRASSRAQATSAIQRMQRGDAAGARADLDVLWQERPYDLQIVLNRVNAVCVTGGLDQQDRAGVTSALTHVKVRNPLVHRWLSRALDLARTHQCPGMDLDDVADWIDAASRNPNIVSSPRSRQGLLSLAGRAALARGEHATALRKFNGALDVILLPEAAASQTILLASSGDLLGARAHLNYYDALRAHPRKATGYKMSRLHAWVLERQGYWDFELGELRRKIDAELAAQEADKP